VTDYERDLARIDAEIARLENDPWTLPAEGERTRLLAFGQYQRAALTGDPEEIMAVEPVIDAAVERAGPWPDLYLLRANLHFKLHRLTAVRENLALVSDSAHSPKAAVLAADLLVQEGRFEEAEAGYDRLIADDRSWDVLARLAHLKMRIGDFAAADRLYREAEDELTAKEMRSYAWVEVQCGLLDMTRGRIDEADVHFARADMAYSGYWEVERRIGELRAAEGRLDEAIALYLNLLRRHSRPEIQQALGTLYAQRARVDEANRWHERALATYRASAERGEIHYLHHLSEFYADIAENGAEAVRWARLDLELRPGPLTRAALAWALYRDGQHEAALEAIRQALASGIRDAGLFVHAATIARAAGREQEGHAFMHAAADITPRYETAHVHH
jgi:tetratricopeptide (TPR) repeat protein